MQINFLTFFCLFGICVASEKVPPVVGTFVGRLIYPLSQDNGEEKIAVDFVTQNDGFKISKVKYENLSSIGKIARASLLLLANGFVFGLVSAILIHMAIPARRNVSDFTRNLGMLALAGTFRSPKISELIGK